jgi:TIR domain
MDVDALEIGENFVQGIERAVGTADAFLVVIGRGWLNAKNADGERRLEDPEDWVRTEISLALSGEAVVIPVLVGGAVMPGEADLPPELAPLADHHALTLVDADWRVGHDRLVTRLRKVVKPATEPPKELEPPKEPERPKEAAPPIVAAVEPGPPATRIPLLATALGLAGSAALIAGTLLQVDLWADPRQGRGGVDRDGLGYFESVAPMTIAVGAACSLLLSYSRSSARLATGLFLGFALAGMARYLSVLGVLASTNIESRYEDSSGFGPGALIALVGCALLTAAALLRIAVEGEERDSGPFLLPRLFVLGGAALVVVATMVPFTTGALKAQTVLERTTNWYAVEPILTAVFAVAVALVLGRARTGASGALIALGVFLGLLWASRYIAFPAWQVNDAASIALGGFLGLAGGVAILLGGLRARPGPAGYSVRVVPAAPSRR